MFYVMLQVPLPGVRSEIFFFETPEDGERFANLLHVKFSTCITEEGRAGDPTEVFPNFYDKEAAK